MNFEHRPTLALKPYANNARTHSPKQIKQIARSIERFGFNNPVLIDDDNQIIAGHGRVEAAKQLKMKTVPCVRLSHLTEADKRAYVLVMSGEPVFRGTRVPPGPVFSMLAEKSAGEIVRVDYPTLSRTDIEAALQQACRLLERQAPWVEQ